MEWNGTLIVGTFIFRNLCNLSNQFRRFPHPKVLKHHFWKASEKKNILKHLFIENFKIYDYHVGNVLWCISSMSLFKLKVFQISKKKVSIYSVIQNVVSNYRPD